MPSPNYLSSVDDDFAGGVMVIPPRGEEPIELQESNEPQSDESLPEIALLPARTLSPEAEENLERLTLQKFGMTPEELSQSVAQAESVRAGVLQEREALAFMQANADFVPSPENAQMLLERVELEGLPINRATLSYEFSRLKAEGHFGQPQERHVPAVGLSRDASIADPDYSGSERSSFDADEFRKLSPTMRREYADAVLHAERNGYSVPSVKTFRSRYAGNKLG